MLKVRDNALRTGIVPNDCVTEGFPRLATPGNSGLALVSDP